MVRRIASDSLLPFASTCSGKWPTFAAFRRNLTDVTSFALSLSDRVKPPWPTRVNHGSCLSVSVTV
jgi:hypothetical protein